MYERDIRPQVEADHFGEVVAIDVDTGHWAIGGDVIAATDGLREKHPDAVNVLCERDGHRTLYHFGGGSLPSRKRRRSCYVCGMNRHRISTTVDGRLLSAARESMPGARDARLMDEALAALCRERRRAEIDEQYEAYDAVPLDTPDAWGDVESFLRAGRAR